MVLIVRFPSAFKALSEEYAACKRLLHDAQVRELALNTEVECSKRKIAKLETEVATLDTKLHQRRLAVLRGNAGHTPTSAT